MLIAIGAFGRRVPSHSLPLISRYAANLDVTSLLWWPLWTGSWRVGFLVWIYSCTIWNSQALWTVLPLWAFSLKICTGCYWSLVSVSSFNFLYVITWFSGHVMMDEAEGETPMIPSSIMQYSIEQSKGRDCQSTLAFLATAINDPASVSADQVDPVVRWNLQNCWILWSSLTFVKLFTAWC